MAGKLQPLEVARQITPGKYPDGDGLYLVVARPASRLPGQTRGAIVTKEIGEEAKKSLANAARLVASRRLIRDGAVHGRDAALFTPEAR
jgi:hypothetical protein